jgi:hypothetical protein
LPELRKEFIMNGKDMDAASQRGRKYRFVNRVRAEIIPLISSQPDSGTFKPIMNLSAVAKKLTCMEMSGYNWERLGYNLEMLGCRLVS